MSDALSALPHQSAHDYSWLAQFFSLLFLPFAHEDLAIIFGAYVVVNDVMPRHSASHCVASALWRHSYSIRPRSPPVVPSPAVTHLSPI